MNLDRILTEIDLEISRLQQAKQLLSEGETTVVKRGPGRPPSSGIKAAAKSASSLLSPKKRTMSAAGRARIAAAQKARWAKTKRAAKKAGAPVKSKSAVKNTAKKATGKKPGRPAGKKAVATVETPPNPVS